MPILGTVGWKPETCHAERSEASLSREVETLRFAQGGKNGIDPMPSLDWIGRKAVENHHNEVPFHLLRYESRLSAGDAESGNLLIQGDNLLALKALLPYYAGQVKCIYIDPPYNTGNENWVYNDNVNSPQIRDWLGKVVGGASEDLSRHDKWLCMMYPRLMLLRRMLRDDGSLWMSIDDNELHHARSLLDEIFGEQNFVATLAWQKRVSPANDAKYFSSDHEYVVVYAYSKSSWRPNRLKRTTQQDSNYKNPDDDPRGPWSSATYTCNKTAEERPNLYYGITNPNTGEVVWPRRTAVWKFNEETHLKNVADGSLYWGADGKSRMPRIKKFLYEMGDIVPRSVLLYSDYGHTQEARTELLEILAESPFTTPKPTRLLQRVLQIATNPDDIVLDSFAGSGTTGHAVLQLNHTARHSEARSAEESLSHAETLRSTQGDMNNRRFILVEMEPDIAQNITAERLRRVIEGYGNTEGLGGGFSFCTLGPTLFDADGRIRAEVTFDELARHVFFVETGEPLPKQANGKSPLLGVSRGTAVYLLYNGILKDKSPNGGNALTRALLSNLPPHDGPKVIYGTSCRVGPERLRSENIAFKQIPYAIKVA
jgi:adenine-specific DNA-methyltransferase